jgi:hypothetical protein
MPPAPTAASVPSRRARAAAPHPADRLTPSALAASPGTTGRARSNGPIHRMRGPGVVADRAATSRFRPRRVP